MELSTADYYKQLKTQDVADLLGVSKASVWNYVNDEIIPNPRYPKPRTPRWKLGEVIEAWEDYIEKQDIKSTGQKGKKGLQPVSKSPVKKIQLEPKTNIAKKLKDRFGIG